MFRSEYVMLSNTLSNGKHTYHQAFSVCFGNPCRHRITIPAVIVPFLGFLIMGHGLGHLSHSMVVSTHVIGLFKMIWRIYINISCSGLYHAVASKHCSSVWFRNGGYNDGGYSKHGKVKVKVPGHSRWLK